MIKQIFNLIFFLVYSSQLQAENISNKLTGTVIGTSDCFDYSTNYCSDTVNTVLNAFDGNLQSIFATCQRTEGWVGLDLGEKHVITKIAYCPRISNSKRMLLGVFEGANNSDFGDATPIYFVRNAPVENILTEQPINCSIGFRYVRYVGPTDVKCNVAELEFYGYSGTGDSSNLTQITNLPTVIIHTTNALAILDRETYIKGIINIISENGTKIFSDSLEIKGRGHYSWNFPKKPYKIKLSHKASLLGLPAIEKRWTLISNYGDNTLMRNLLAFDLSKRLELPYTPAGEPVDFILNGEYKGTYQLSDQIEKATGRVEIEKIKESDTTLLELSGGYLIEMDAYASGEVSWFYSARNRIPVTIQYPEDDEIVSAQSAYIKSHFDLMEKTLFDLNYTDLTNGFRKYIDTETFIRHFLVGEISGNTDTYWSTYMYKKRNDDKFYFGPIWDFDIAYESDYRTYPINNNPEWIYSSTGSAASGVRELVNMIFTDTSMIAQRKSIYANYRNRGIITENTLLKVVDDYASEIDQSQKLNFIRWDILNSQTHMNPVVFGSYAGEVNNVKDYIKNRIIWMDNKLGYVPNSLNETYKSNIYLWVETNTIHLEGLSENATVQIVDITGKIILRKQANIGFSTFLNKGVYLIHVSDKINGNHVLKCLIP